MRGRGVLLAVLLAQLCFAVPGAAADPYVPPEGAPTEPELAEGFPACETPAGTYEGEDQVVGELRGLREEAAADCEALSDRLDLLRERVFWVLVEQLKAQETKVPKESLEMAELIYQRLDHLNELATNPAEGGIITSPLNNRGQVWDTHLEAGESEEEEGDEALTLAAETKEATEVGTEVYNRGIWILVGALLASLTFFALWRVFHGK